MTVVVGTEFSCVHVSADGRRVNLHLLGYLFDPALEGVCGPSVRCLRASRLDRGRRIVETLAAGGYPISWAQVQRIAGSGVVGRPHVARALVESGVVSSVDEAFAGLISPSSPYYVRKTNLDVFDALRLIRAAGGVTVFAHPLASRRGPIVDDDVIAAMAAAGLDGIEVDHADHDRAERRRAAGARRRPRPGQDRLVGLPRHQQGGAARPAAPPSPSSTSGCSTGPPRVGPVS